MQLIRARLLTLAVPLALSCGPDSGGDWGIGIYSDYTAGGQGLTSSVLHYDVRPDGTVLISSVDIDNVETDQAMRTWVRRDEFTIDILFPDAGEGGIEAWRLTPDTCERVNVTWISGGELGLETGLYRGAVCVERLPPCPDPGIECDSAKTVWCEGVTPPCEEE